MKQAFALTLILLFTNSCSLLPDDFLGPKASPLELYETGSDEYPLLMVDEDGTQFVFSEDLRSL